MTRQSVFDRVETLASLCELAEDRLPVAALDEARSVVQTAGERLERSSETVVAALCGGTGTGKSSLFNAVADAELSPVGLRRPTTTRTRALVVDEGEDGTADLLTWLGVSERHRVPPKEDLPGGLVLLDLPDHDSVVNSHRREVDALVARVDVLLWVVDPLKYAAASLHEGYLRQLAEHAEVLVFVMNRSDELSREEVDRCVAHLRGLLGEVGLEGARTLTTSVRTGKGIDELRALLAEEVRRRTAISKRVDADVRTAARALLPGTGPPVAAQLDGETAVRGLAGVAGVDRVADDAAYEYRTAATAATRPVVTVLIAAVVSALLRPIRGARRLLDRASESRATPGASALPVHHALLTLVDQVAAGLPAAWRDRLVDAAGGDGRGLARSVTGAVDRVPLRPPQRRWWAPVRILLSVLELAAAAGLAWLVVLGLVDWLQLPDVPVPHIAGRLPWPTALLLGGLLARGGLGVLRRRAVSRGAHRHRQRVAERLGRAVREVVERDVIEPLREETAIHDRLRDGLERLLR